MAFHCTDMQEKVEPKLRDYSAPAADENRDDGFTQYRVDASNLSCILYL